MISFKNDLTHQNAEFCLQAKNYDAKSIKKCSIF